MSNEFYFKKSHLEKKLLKMVGDNLANELNVGSYRDIIENFITEIELKNKESAIQKTRNTSHTTLNRLLLPI